MSPARTSPQGPTPDPVAARSDPAPLGDSPRHQARERILAILYESEMKGESPQAVLAAQPVLPDAYVREVVGVVGERCDEIDALVGGVAEGWPVDRMPVVDRNVLRMAVAELLARPDVPVAVVLNEAVELAKAFSTEESGGFVNGVLSTLAERIRGGADA